VCSHIDFQDMLRVESSHKKPNIAVTKCDSTQVLLKNNDSSSDSNPHHLKAVNSDFDCSDRYLTASSGDDLFDNDDFDDDDDDGDDGFCIRLDSDAESLSGLHIDLSTLKDVSRMLAHYKPIIQSDRYGNPIFVPPPPPSDLNSDGNEQKAGYLSFSSEIEVEDEFQCALRELDDVILNDGTNDQSGTLFQQDGTFLSDAMSELTDVMEKMTYFAGETVDDDVN